MAEQQPHLILDPEQIAEFLGSRAERKPDKILRDPRTNDEVRRLENWEIFLFSPLMLRETRLFITPEDAEVVIQVKDTRGPDEIRRPITAVGNLADVKEHGNMRMGGITAVKYSLVIVSFVRETPEYSASIGVSKVGVPFSRFYPKSEESDGLILDMADYGRL